MGNITSRSDLAGGAPWTYDSVKKHAVRQAGDASHTYTYDANGNAITRNGYAITWSSYNYPLVINGPNKTLTFKYGPNRERYQQDYVNGSTLETTMYVGGMLEKVTTGGVVDWRHYISASGQTVAVMSRKSDGTNTLHYLLEDHQGSISQITDENGASFVEESFTAFGARRAGDDWASNCNCTDLAKMKSVTRRGFTAQEAIGGVSMGLNHMNGRVQDAITGRFLSPDPYVTEPGSTQGFNRYSYVMNNPMSYTDPSGFAAEHPRPQLIAGGGADGINPRDMNGYREADVQSSAGNLWDFMTAGDNGRTIYDRSLVYQQNWTNHEGPVLYPVYSDADLSSILGRGSGNGNSDRGGGAPTTPGSSSGGKDGGGSNPAPHVVAGVGFDTGSTVGGYFDRLRGGAEMLWNDALNSPQQVGAFLSDGAVGFGDGVYHSITFGYGDLSNVRSALGIGEFSGDVDVYSLSFTVGSIEGGAVLGGALGLAGRARSGWEFSHWVPDRFFRNALGLSRSGARFWGRHWGNGAFVPKWFHAITDAARFPGGWMSALPKFPFPVGFILRTPPALLGGGLGATASPDEEPQP